AKSDATILESLNEQLRQARIEYETFQNSLYAAHSELRTSRPETTPTTLSEVSALTNASTAFLEYVVTDSKTYLLVLTKSDGGGSVLRSYPIAATSSEIAKRTRAFRDLI